MKIGIEQALTATGVGVGDVLIRKYMAGKNVGPLSVDDLYRFVLAGGSFAVNYLGYERDYSEVLFYSSLPLVVDSVANIVEKETTKGASSTAVHIVNPSPVVSVSPAPTSAVPP